MQIFLISALGGILIFLIVIMILPSNEKAAVRGRLLKYLKSVGVDEVQDLVLKEKREKEKKRKAQKFQLVSRELSSYLAMSGVRLSATEYLCSWGLSVFVPVFAVFLFSRSFVTTLGVGIIGFSIPPFLVQRSRKKRQEEFNRQLGESLTIMGNCVRAGFSFQQALESIASEMQPPISAEFAKALREMHYGVSFEDALKHMVDRVKNKDLDLLVSAVLTSSQVGGNLSDILEVISETVGDRLKIKAQVRVLTSSGRMSGMVIGLLPVFIILILMLINPDYFMAFFETGAGKIMLALSAALEATGFLVIRKIVDIKY